MLGTSTILCCLWPLLSLLFYNEFAMIIFLSLKYFTVCFSIELLIGCLKIFPLEIGAGRQLGKSTYPMGGQMFFIVVGTY